MDSSLLSDQEYERKIFDSAQSSEELASHTLKRSINSFCDTYKEAQDLGCFEVNISISKEAEFLQKMAKLEGQISSSITSEKVISILRLLAKNDVLTLSKIVSSSDSMMQLLRLVVKDLEGVFISANGNGVGLLKAAFTQPVSETSCQNSQTVSTSKPYPTKRTRSVRANSSCSSFAMTSSSFFSFFTRHMRKSKPVVHPTRFKFTDFIEPYPSTRELEHWEKELRENIGGTFGCKPHHHRG